VPTWIEDANVSIFVQNPNYFNMCVFTRVGDIVTVTGSLKINAVGFTTPDLAMKFPAGFAIGKTMNTIAWLVFSEIDFSTTLWCTFVEGR
jgi:hypothetical protein